MFGHIPHRSARRTTEVVDQSRERRRFDRGNDGTFADGTGIAGSRHGGTHGTVWATANPLSWSGRAQLRTPRPGSDRTVCPAYDTCTAPTRLSGKTEVAIHAGRDAERRRPGGTPAAGYATGVCGYPSGKSPHSVLAGVRREAFLMKIIVPCVAGQFGKNFRHFSIASVTGAHRKLRAKLPLRLPPGRCAS
jgi:hypothetical protein